MEKKHMFHHPPKETAFDMSKFRFLMVKPGALEGFWVFFIAFAPAYQTIPGC